MDGENKIAAFEIATGSSNGETVSLDDRLVLPCSFSPLAFSTSFSFSSPPLSSPLPSHLLIQVNLANPDACAKLPKHLRLKAAQNVLAMQAQLEAMLATLR